MSNPSVRIMSVRLKQMTNFDRNVLQQYRITPEHVNDATRAIYEAVNRSAKKLQDDLEDRAKAERDTECQMRDAFRWNRKERIKI